MTPSGTLATPLPTPDPAGPLGLPGPISPARPFRRAAAGGPAHGVIRLELLSSSAARALPPVGLRTSAAWVPMSEANAWFQQ